MKCPKCHFDNPEDTNFCGKCATPLPSSREFPVSLTETLKTPIKELTTGSTFANRYQVIEELGKGGMGRVYKVFDTKIKEKVALKLIKPDIATDKETIERFNNELRLARKVRHKNVCGMFDLGEAEGARFITMEYVQGEDLKSMIRMLTGLTVGTVLSVGKQICDGLAEAHSLGVVHRDLKPQNIMIDKGGNAKIMDFGIARSVREKGITGASVMIGTPEYMSPEQAEAKEVDHRSDIYSLGIILYEMATGRVPFEGDTALSIAMKHKGETPKNPRVLNPNIPDDLGRLILTCLEKDRSNRYQSARDVSAELEKIEAGIPISERIVPERKPSGSREITITLRWRKLILPAAIGLAIVAAALFAFLKTRGPHYDSKRIIVSVFENQTGDKAYDPIGRIVSDWITQGLNRTGLAEIVSVPPGESAPGTPQEAERIRALARNKGAGTLISGSYFLQGQMLSFHAQILDTAKGRLLKALDPVSGSAEEPLKAVEILRQKILGALAGTTDTRIRPFVESSAQPPTYAAYKEFVAAWDAFDRFDCKRARDLSLKAAELDPSFQSSLLLAAVSRIFLSEFPQAEELLERLDQARNQLSPFEQLCLDWMHANLRGDFSGQLQATRQLSSIAVGIWNLEWAIDAIDNNRPREAIKALSTLDLESSWMKGLSGSYWYYVTRAYHMLGEHRQELKQARRGRKQYPESIYVLGFEARAMAALGRFDEIQKLVDESMNLKGNPAQVMLNVSVELRAHGFKKESFQLLDRAIEWLKARPAEEKEKEDSRGQLAYAYYYAEKWQESRALFVDLLKEYPKSLSSLNYLAMCGTLAARTGDKEEALRISKQLEEAGKIPYIWGNHTYNRACIASVLGDKENAVRLLREAISQGYSYDGLDTSLSLELLRDYGPFKELIKPKG